MTWKTGKSGLKKIKIQEFLKQKSCWVASLMKWIMQAWIKWNFRKHYVHVDNEPGHFIVHSRLTQEIWTTEKTFESCTFNENNKTQPIQVRNSHSWIISPFSIHATIWLIEDSIVNDKKQMSKQTVRCNWGHDSCWFTVCPLHVLLGSWEMKWFGVRGHDGREGMWKKRKNLLILPDSFMSILKTGNKYIYQIQKDMK